jgi:hypothetical protein
MGKDKYMDGFKYDVPAEKLGYIQKLGAGRMTPGKKGDLTAMKMMHGDAAAKYYDGAGMYMNGAPKYEGAAKGMYTPMKHIDGTNKGHEGSDRPSYVESKTSQTVVPATGSSTSTSSSGGSTSGSKTKKVYTKPKRTAKGDAAYAALTPAQRKAQDDKYKKMNTKTVEVPSSSSSSNKKSTKPSVKTEVKKDLKVSKNKGKNELLKDGQEVEKNRRGRAKAGSEERLNLATRDSTSAAQKSLKGKPVNEKNLMNAVQRGNQAARRTLVNRNSNPDNSFGESLGEFRYTRDQAKAAFSDKIGTGQGTVTNDRGTKANVGDKIPVTGGYNYAGRGGNLTPSQVGSTRNFGKKSKGKYTVNSVKTDAGTSGSYGGFKTPQEYLSGGTPKMPKGPNKFGMKK